MRQLILALALVSCAAEPLPVQQGPAPIVCQPYIRCTFNGHCADMVAFCGCMKVIQDKPKDCVTCDVDVGKPWMPLKDKSACYYQAPVK